MGLLTRLEHSLGRFAIPNLSLYLVIGQVLFWSVSFLGFFDLERIALLPAAVYQGEVWRIVTFLFLPPAAHPVFIAFAWYMFWMMGSALETHWGAFRYNLFLLIGWALTVAVAFLFPGSYATNVFLAGSVFLAFAFLNPDFEILIFFILPVKIKWLALIAWLVYAYAFFRGGLPVKLMVLASVGNFLVFFAGAIIHRMRTGRRQMEHRARHSALREETQEARHRCHVCGKTELTHPQLDFRYCSKCAGEECYCAEHIANHVHTTAAGNK
jgi:membrane associated rhomboid family serine protease